MGGRDHLADVGDRAGPDRHKTGGALAVASGLGERLLVGVQGVTGRAESDAAHAGLRRQGRADVVQQIGRPVELRRPVGEDGDGALGTARIDEIGNDLGQGRQGAVTEDDRLQA